MPLLKVLKVRGRSTMLPAGGTPQPAAGAPAATNRSKSKRPQLGVLRTVDPLERLPDQLVQQVVSYLPVTDLGHVIAVAPHYRRSIPAFVVELRCLAHHVGQLNWRLYTEVRSLTVTCDAAAAVATDVAYWLAKAASWGCFRRVETLHLYGNRIGDEGLALLTFSFANGAFPSLRRVDLSWNELTNVSALGLAKVLEERGRDGRRLVLPMLKELIMERNKLGDEGCSALVQSLTGKKGDQARLTILSLSSNGELGKSDMTSLARAFQGGEMLRVLSLNCCNIGDQGLRALTTSFSQLKSLQRLDLQGNHIGNSGASLVAQALLSGGGMSELEALNLQSNCFSDSGVVALSEALRTGCCPKLACLDLSGNGIACEGAMALASIIAGGQCALQSLSLAWNNLSDEGATAFAANVDVKCPFPTSSHPSLEKLDMGNNSIGDPGVKALARAFRSAASLSHLQQIDLTGNDFHDCGLSDLVVFMREAMGGVRRLHKVAVYNGISLDQLFQPEMKPKREASKNPDHEGTEVEEGAGPNEVDGDSVVDKTERRIFIGMAGYLMYRLCVWMWNAVAQ